jgi:hypothetical protein
MPTDYSAIITDLEGKRLELMKSVEVINAAIAGIRILQSSATPGAPNSEAPQVQPADRMSQFANMSIPLAAETLLRTVGHPLSTREICDGLKQEGFASKATNFMTTIGSVLNRHSKAVGRVRRVPNGWGLAEWSEPTEPALPFTA